MFALRDVIEERFAYKRNFSSVQDLLDDINKHFPKYQIRMAFPFVVGGYKFDAKYHSYAGDLAVSVVLKHGKTYGKDEVAYILSQMEDAEAKGLIRGGVVIYNTDNIKEWKNACVALDRPTTYNGKKIMLVSEYCIDWEEPNDGEKVSRRYAIFLTKKARELDN